MNLHRYALLILILLHAGIAPATPAQQPLAEQLEYEASYEGPLAAGGKIAIANVSLRTRGINLPAFAEPLFETSLHVSSEIFPFVEENYPFRVRIRSLYHAKPFAVLALEKYKLTDELKQELAWVNKERGRVGRYRPQAGGEELPAAIGNWVNSGKPFHYYKPARHKILDGLVDRLSMLQSLRLKQMVPGVEYRFSVTDGKHLMEYRVEVVGLEQIQFGGKKQQAWKLLLNALYTRKGVTSPRHAPIQLWLSQDQPALPLRFVNHHPLGTFTVDLLDVGK